MEGRSFYGRSSNLGSGTLPITRESGSGTNTVRVRPTRLTITNSESQLIQALSHNINNWLVKENLLNNLQYRTMQSINVSTTRSIHVGLLRTDLLRSTFD